MLEKKWTFCFAGRSSTRGVRFVDEPDEDDDIGSPSNAPEGVELQTMDVHMRPTQRFEDDEEVDELGDFMDDDEEDLPPPIRSGTRSPRQKFELDSGITSRTSRRKRPTGLSGRPLGGFVANVLLRYAVMLSVMQFAMSGASQKRCPSLSITR